MLESLQPMYVLVGKEPW